MQSVTFPRNLILHFTALQTSNLMGLTVFFLYATFLESKGQRQIFPVFTTIDDQ